MKKIILTSLFAAVAVSAANAGVIDNNPLYRPNGGHFYSVTDLATDTAWEGWGLGEEFGYGINDKLSVIATTKLSAYFPESDLYGNNNYAWDNFGLKLNYRVLDDKNIKADVYGGVAQNYATTGGETKNGKFHYKNFDDLETTSYDWTVGARAGYTTKEFTIAGLVEYTYSKDDIGTDVDSGKWTFGLNGQYVIDTNWNITGGASYALTMLGDDNPAKIWANAHVVNAYVGANYNIDDYKFVGVYVAQNWGKASTGNSSTTISSDWEIADETIIGAKFGIDF
ncbi:MAG: hypothetical protein LBO08_00275 [Rickettsiales bacterium]|jgi:hypothetical protein|nr:hypothetical protein [Rickettsiales bacterium]